MVTHRIGRQDTQEFGAIIQGMTVVACNEKGQDDVSPSTVKKALHQDSRADPDQGNQ
jgi:hypothetical protein